MTNLSSLQAMAGRFLTNSEPVAWEDGSRARCVHLVSEFQGKRLDEDGLRAAFADQRNGPPATRPKMASVALIPLVGILSPGPSIFEMLGFGTNVRGFMRDLTVASLDPNVRAIVIPADSPGGSVRLLPEASSLLRLVRQRKPVVVSVAGMAASACYWLASNASSLECTPSGHVGSIGVVCERVSVSKMLEREGIAVDVIASSRFKSEGHPALACSPAERAHLQAQVDQAHDAFIHDISLGRCVPAATIRATYGEGRLLDAASAVRVGMIDTVATCEDTIARTMAAPSQATASLARRSDAFRRLTESYAAQQARASIAMRRAELVAAARGRV